MLSNLRYRLRVQEGASAAPRFFENNQVYATVGRSAASTNKLEDELVSRRHVALLWFWGNLWVIDLASTNPALLDGKPLRPLLPTLWRPDVTLQLGDTQLSIESDKPHVVKPRSDGETNKNRAAPGSQLRSLLRQPFSAPTWVILLALVIVLALIGLLTTTNINKREERIGNTPVRTPIPTFTPTPLGNAASTTEPVPTPTVTLMPVPQSNDDTTQPLAFTVQLHRQLVAKQSDSLIPGAIENTAAAAEAAVSGASLPHFRLVQKRLWSKAENGGCRGQHLLRMHVVDTAGNPLNGITLQGIYTGVQLITGARGKGDGVAEFDLYEDGEDFMVSADHEGHLVTSDVSTQHTTISQHIAQEILIAAGYCADTQDCLGFYADFGCKGHFSWEISFQRSN